MVEEESIKTTQMRLESGTAKVGVVGLGYVGLPLAMALARVFHVIGYDVDEGRQRLLISGESYVDDVDNETLKSVTGRNFEIALHPGQLRVCDVLIVCVPTPLDADGIPDLTCVAQSAGIVTDIVRKGMLVILESTSYPGTTEEYLGRAIRASGHEIGKDVALAFSPERVDPGNTQYGITNTPKIVGGYDEASTKLAAMLYAKVVEAGVVTVSDCRTAEASKILENIFRGVNIALINEMSLVFDKMGVNTWEAIRAAATKPFAFMPHYPGPGVGGHCIPLDPLYLSFKAKQYGITPRFIELSHEVNDYMKHHTVLLTVDALRASDIAPEDAVVGVLGLAYKKDISDTRESPAADIIVELARLVRSVIVSDPRAKSIHTRAGVFESQPLEVVVSSANCLVFVTNHREYELLDIASLPRENLRAIVDTRNIFDGDEVVAAGLVYRGIGKGSEMSCRTQI